MLVVKIQLAERANCIFKFVVVVLFDRFKSVSYRVPSWLNCEKFRIKSVNSLIFVSTKQFGIKKKLYYYKSDSVFVRCFALLRINGEKIPMKERKKENYNGVLIKD